MPKAPLHPPRADDAEPSGFYVVDSPSGSKAVPTNLGWAAGRAPR